MCKSSRWSTAVAFERYTKGLPRCNADGLNRKFQPDLIPTCHAEVRMDSYPHPALKRDTLRSGQGPRCSLPCRLQRVLGVDDGFDQPRVTTWAIRISPQAAPIIAQDAALQRRKVGLKLWCRRFW